MKPLRKLTALAALCLIAAPAVMGQGRKELRINEVMVKNDSSIVDDYGRHSAWIELVNPTHAPINISSIYLTDDLSNPQKYFVPTGDSRTKIEKGQSVLFFADGKPQDGTFHLNFELTPGKDNFIAVFDADGISLLDSVTVPAALTADMSYARATDAGLPWQIRDNSSTLNAITPGGHNVIPVPNNKIAKFKEMDENGGAMTIMAMAIVFSALLVLCLCFYLIKRIGTVKTAAPAPQAAPVAASEGVDAEVAAAIALALHLHSSHGDGSSRITIRHNPASAWNSKIHAMRVVPNHLNR